MARQRVQVESGVTPERFTPTATPVDRFVRPEAGAGLAQLARGLATMAPSLSRLEAVLSEQDNRKQRDAGEAAARQLYEEGMSYKKAIEAGKIKPSDSPWFRLGAEEFFGRNAASTYASDLQLALKRSGLKDTATDPEQFDEFERQFRAGWIAQNVGQENRSRHFESAFGNSIDQVVGNARAAFAASAGVNLVNAAKEGVHQSIYDSALEAHAGSLDDSSFVEGINLSVRRAVAMGVSKEDANKMAAQAIVNAAVDSGDETILDLMDQVKMGTGMLGSASWAVEMKRAARRAIDGQQEEDNKDALQAAEDKVFAAFQATNNINSPEVQEALAAYQALPGGHSESSRVLNNLRSLERSIEAPDPDYVHSLAVRAVEGNLTTQELGAHAKNLDTSSYLTIRNLIREKPGGGVLGSGKTPQELEEDAVQDPIYKLYNTIGVDLLTGDDLMTAEEAAVVLAQKQGDILVNYTEWFGAGGFRQPARVRKEVMQRLVSQAARDDEQEGVSTAEAGSREMLEEAWTDPQAISEEAFTEFNTAWEAGDLSDLTDDTYFALRTLVPKPKPEDLEIFRQAQLQARGLIPQQPAATEPTPQETPEETEEEVPRWVKSGVRRVMEDIAQAEAEIARNQALINATPVNAERLTPEQLAQAQAQRQERYGSEIEELEDRISRLRERIRMAQEQFPGLLEQ